MRLQITWSDFYLRRHFLPWVYERAHASPRSVYILRAACRTVKVCQLSTHAAQHFRRCSTSVIANRLGTFLARDSVSVSGSRRPLFFGRQEDPKHHSNQQEGGHITQ